MSKSISSSITVIKFIFLEISLLFYPNYSTSAPHQLPKQVKLPTSFYLPVSFFLTQIKKKQPSLPTAIHTNSEQTSYTPP